jgi:hypothetical protein
LKDYDMQKIAQISPPARMWDVRFVARRVKGIKEKA